MDISKATPRPWVTFEGGSSGTQEIIFGICEEGKSIGAILGAETAVALCAIGDDDGYYEDASQLKHDFALIVTAVNSYEPMLQALNAARDCISTMFTRGYNRLGGTVDWDQIAGPADPLNVLDRIEAAIAEGKQS